MLNRLTDEQIQEARKLDLLTYLGNYEPDKLVKVSNSTYCTKEHDSLKISKGKWCWFSRGIGGRSALDYLIKAEGYGFVDAVRYINGKISECPPVPFEWDEEDENEKIYIQPLNPVTDCVETYLKNRGISEFVLRYCIENGLLAETEDYHSALFLGYDKNGVIRYAAQRGTLSNFKGENAGSDKRFSFRIDGFEESDTLHVFESAIDLLSYASLVISEGGAWRINPLLSMGGVYKTDRKESVPMALEYYLNEHPNITTVKLHLDNDEIGRDATQSIIRGLCDKYTVLDEPPEEGKDMNDWLLINLRRKGSEKSEDKDIPG